MQQQLQNGMYRLVSRITQADRLDQLYQYLATLPPIQGQQDFLSTLPETIRQLFPEDFVEIFKNPILRQELLDARNSLVLPSYIWISGYNALLSIMEQTIPMPDLSILQIRLSVTWTQANTYDHMLDNSRLPLTQKEPSGPVLESALFRSCPPLALPRFFPDSHVQI